MLKDKIKIRPEAEKDIRELGSKHLQLGVLRVLQELIKNPYKGKHLVYQELQYGDLSDCYRWLVFGPNYSDAQCIVYRVTKDHIPEIITVAPRKGSEAYKITLKRLGRPSRPYGKSRPKKWYKPS